MTKDKKRLVLLDGSSYLFRAYHALPPLVTASGQPTGAIYGVINMIRRLIKDEKPDYMAVVFDTKEKTFRHQEYKEYKANRPEMPDELASQIKPLHAIIKAMGLPLLTAPGFEADDVIGTLAKQGEAQGLRVIISTGDKDLAQLVTPDVTLVNTMTDVVFDEQGVEQKFSVKPNQIIDYLALIGDTSDNVPGVPKVGPKTAAKWLAAYQTLDNLIAHKDDIKGKVGDNFREHVEKLALSKWLVTIDCDVPLSMTPSELQISAEDTQTLKDWFSKLEFKTWLKNLDQEDSPPPSTQRNYQCIDSVKTLKQWMKGIQQSNCFCFDLETTSLNTLDAQIVGIALCAQAFEAFYIPVAHISEQTQLDLSEVLALLQPLLESESVAKIGQNLKYDCEVLAQYDIQVKGPCFDTMLESYVLNPQATRHDMDSLASYYLSETTISYEELCGKGAKQIPFAQVPIESACLYACEDADITFRLHQHLMAKLEDIPELLEVFLKLEQPFMHILIKMEQTGVRIDEALLEKQSQELGETLIRLETEAHALAKEPFNLGSPKQLQAILFEKLGLPVIAKTPKGQPSTAEGVLQELSHDFELPKIILEHRSLSKLKSTYTDKLPLAVHSKTQRVHTHYHQAVTATGRLSSSDPNLQNIPIRTEEGKKIRKAFVAEPGRKLLAADYSQIELRIMAHLSKDTGLCQAFAKGEDIHASTASAIFNCPLSEVCSDMRRKAKAINFGLIYGMSAFGLARQLDITREEAESFMQTYFERFPGIHDYMESTRDKASKQGYVTTMIGRRLYVPDINSKNGLRRKAAMRAAINAPMQGSAADLIKQAMCDIHQWIETDSPNVDMIMQVHDELVFEVDQSDIEPVQQKIKQFMEQAVQLEVPLVVDVGVGDNWQQAH